MSKSRRGIKRDGMLDILGKDVEVVTCPATDSAGTWDSTRCRITVSDVLNEQQWTSTVWHEVKESILEGLLGADISAIPQPVLLEQIVCALLCLGDYPPGLLVSG